MGLRLIRDPVVALIPQREKWVDANDVLNSGKTGDTTKIDNIGYEFERFDRGAKRTKRKDKRKARLEKLNAN